MSADADFPFDFIRIGRPISVQLIAGRGHYEAVVKAVMGAERWRYLDCGAVTPFENAAVMPVLGREVAAGDGPIAMTSVWGQTHLNVGWFDDVSEMEKVYDRFKGKRGIAVKDGAYRLE